MKISKTLKAELEKSRGEIRAGNFYTLEEVKSALKISWKDHL
ncbi:MAG: hypothetical protein V1875_02700 [Candidatus Altiarchaeota archaeon]